MKLNYLNVLILYFLLCTVPAANATPKAIFTDVTIESGLGGLPLLETYSAASADYNRDGYPDFLVSHHDGAIRLWKNRANGTFEDASKLIPFDYADAHGVSFIDLNHDAYPDITIACGANRGRGKGDNLFYLNKQGKGFVLWKDAAKILLDPKGRSRSITPTDFNSDGITDLLLFNFYQKDRPHRLAMGIMQEPYFIANDGASGIEPVRSFAMRSLKFSVKGELYFIATGPDVGAGKIYKKRQGKLIEVSEELGISEQHAISCVPFDYDNDGDLDLFFTHRNFYTPLGADIHDGGVKFLLPHRGEKLRGFVIPLQPGRLVFDVLFEGRKEHGLLHFGKDKLTIKTDKPAVELLSPILRGEPQITDTDIGSFVWYDDKGELHFIFVGNKNMANVFGYIQLPTINGDLHEISPFPKPTLRNNTLYRNDNGHFVNITNRAGIAGNGLGVDALAADFNNDGLIDLYQVNAGYLFSETNPPNLLFLNNGDETFSESAALSNSTGSQKGSGNSALALDYDQDGDMDLVLLNGFMMKPVTPGPMVLLRNDSNEHLKATCFKLQGREGNSQAWGTSIIVSQAERKTMLQKDGYSGYLSTSDTPLCLGVGDSNSPVSANIYWPNGSVTRMKNVQPGYVTVQMPSHISNETNQTH